MLTKIKNFINGMNEDKKVSDELSGIKTADTEIEKRKLIRLFLKIRILKL
ncbi:MAG: hypothetical protein IPI04_15020 [Ignavibacteria bacterium]|nr:hypothetical protein [Ignavibacteria bacterium]